MWLPLGNKTERSLQACTINPIVAAFLVMPASSVVSCRLEKNYTSLLISFSIQPNKIKIEKSTKEKGKAKIMKQMKQPGLTDIASRRQCNQNKGIASMVYFVEGVSLRSVLRSNR
jgi:hypothetical protein